MNFQQILLTVIGIILTTFVSWGCETLIVFIKNKMKNSKNAALLESAINIVGRAVKSTYQTYVENLKDKDMFNKNAQIEALNKAKETARKELTSEAQAYITETFGSLDSWLENSIEAAIYDLKN